MNFKQLPQLLQLLTLSVLICGLHFLILHFFNVVFTSFYYSLFTHYLFLTALSTLVLIVVQKIAKKNIDQVGFAFLGVMTVKLVVAYLFLLPLLHTSQPGVNSEKTSFFVLFILFLATDVYFTSQILNANAKIDKKE